MYGVEASRDDEERKFGEVGGMVDGGHWGGGVGGGGEYREDDSFSTATLEEYSMAVSGWKCDSGLTTV